jgi:ABC-type Zn uptake system ZnuABC Zn-binding protein ZnuA
MRCTTDRGDQLVIVTSTTMLEAVVASVAGDRARVSSIVPGGQCPGHFDLKPRQMEAIEQADFFVYHGYEAWLSEVMRIIGEQTRPMTVNLEGSWMVPDVHIEAIYAVRDLLMSIDAAGEKTYEENALSYENQVLRAGRTACNQLGPYHETRVICSEMQSDLLTWVGFDVLSTYGRTENLTPKMIEHLIETGRRHGVSLVVDNLQSGPGIGEQIAMEIDATHVVLTNFPLKRSYTEALEQNVERLRAKLES